MKKTKQTVKKMLNDFFINNKGKLFSILFALNIILAVVVPLSSIITDFVRSPFNTNAKIKIVSLGYDEDETLPTIGIELRNTGQAVAYLNKIEIIMKDYTVLNQIYDEMVYSDDFFKEKTYVSYRVDPSYIYQINVFDDKLFSLDISQAIQKDDVDYFHIKLCPELSEYQTTIMTFKLRIYYNEKGQYTDSSFITITQNYNKSIYLSEYSDSIDENCILQNFKDISRINKYNSTKSPGFKFLYNNHKENKKIFS